MKLKKEIAKIKARLKELETKLAISSMPEEVSALLDDLGMLPDADVDNRVSLEMIEEYMMKKTGDEAYDLYLRFIMIVDFVSSLTDSEAKKLGEMV